MGLMLATIESTPAGRPRPERQVLTGADLAYALVAVGMSFVVAADGSLGWRLLRVAIVLELCILAIWTQRVWPRRRVALVSASIGTVSGAVGTTIGASYATRTGVSLQAVGGIFASIGGLALMLAGLWTLVRFSHGWWRRVVPLAVTVILGYVLVMPLCVAVLATNVPRPALGRATPADRGLSYVNATLRTSDGVSLSGWYVPSTNKAAVVLLHGASSTRSAVLDHAVVLARHGYGVLLFDARGHGRSGGRAMDFGWYGDEDVAAAVDYLQSRADVDPHRIGAIGMSMGGEEVVGALAADARIRGAVAEGATNRVYADKVWLSDEYGLRGWAQKGVEWVTYGLTDALTAAGPPISLRAAVQAAAPRPVLLIAAATMPDEQHADRRIQGAAPGSVELWIVPGAGHTGGLRTAPREWEQRVVRFFGRALR
jgi:uncharacterized protein